VTPLRHIFGGPFPKKVVDKGYAAPRELAHSERAEQLGMMSLAVKLRLIPDLGAIPTP
jgi:hypothetical protein